MVEGGPSNKQPAGGSLTTSINPPGLGLAKDRPKYASNPGNPSGSNTQVGTSYTGANACSLADSIYNAAMNYGNNVPYLAVPYWPGTYNSDSYAGTLLRGVGLGSYFGSGDYWFPGWTKTVPGLTPPPQP